MADEEIQVLIVPESEGTALTTNPANECIVLAFRIVYRFISAGYLVVCIVFLGIFWTMYKEHRHTIYYQIGIAAAIFGLLAALLAMRHSFSKMLQPGDWYMFLLLFYLGVNTVGVGMLLAKVPGALYPMVVVSAMTVICVFFTLLRCMHNRGWCGCGALKGKGAPPSNLDTKEILRQISSSDFISKEFQSTTAPTTTTITKGQLTEIERTNFGRDPNKNE